MAEPKFVVFSVTDRLALAKNILGQREEEYYRLWLSTPADVDNPTLGTSGDEIKRLQDEVAKLEKESK